MQAVKEDVRKMGVDNWKEVAADRKLCGRIVQVMGQCPAVIVDI